MIRASALLLALSLSGCALAPNTVRLEAEHVSHLTQHAPFSANPTNYGYQDIGVVAHWNVFKGAFAELREAYSISKVDRDVDFTCYGALAGPKEIFTAKVGYEWRVK